MSSRFSRDGKSNPLTTDFVPCMVPTPSSCMATSRTLRYASGRGTAGLRTLLLLMNIPCLTPLISTLIFSEMLPANGLPLSSRNGLGVPGLTISKTATERIGKTNKTEKIFKGT